MSGTLAETQRWMAAAITGPAAATAAAAAVVNATPVLGAQERLELYRGAYWRRLVGCLRESYPALRHALGDGLFDDFALEYLAANPPRGTRLGSLGAAFPDHLQATRPDGESWPQFLVDLARLERVFWEVYDGPGVEGVRLPTRAELGEAFERGSTAAAVRTAPCVRLLHAAHPVDEYMLAVRRGEDPLLPGPQACHIVLARRDFSVTLTRVDAGEHALLAQLAGGGPLALRDGAVQSLVCTWAQRGWLVR